MKNLYLMKVILFRLLLRALFVDSIKSFAFQKAVTL